MFFGVIGHMALHIRPFLERGGGGGVTCLALHHYHALLLRVGCETVFFGIEKHEKLRSNVKIYLLTVL